ncbi:28S ribosomal protein S31, mitochondrial isoform X2 [Coccinella septempunctata]|uniref:28S ribosomal protein S31, mitochondrial isoform X2 n=1 Tax=Coccinella septempunctata TaxID=41139 RepID=UPI001D07DF7F|nr:28S ribosomal protein S31, mitochondrial isoform X2 [Coccinella septempunctata]
MSKLALVTPVRYPFKSSKNKFVVSLCSRWYCKSDHESSDVKSIEDQKKDTNKSDTNEKARLTRLNTLLKTMIEDSPKLTASRTVELAKPIAKWGKSIKNVNNETPTQAPKIKEQDIITAAKEVAETLGGDTKKTESELLKKLLGNKEEEETDAISSLSDILKGMKIDRSKPHVEQKTRSEQVRQLMNRNMKRHQPSPGRPKQNEPPKRRQIRNFDIINLYGTEPLGIFTSDPKEYTDHVENTTWKSLTQREMKLLTTHPPSNYFQEMILWTEQGKLWKFPIDNEQGLEEENNISFAEHVFLDKHLESWCPPKGPIRHFMELVCIGLSKNPYLTVSAKIEHIEWYRNYFEDKRNLLKDVGAALNEQKCLE